MDCLFSWHRNAFVHVSVNVQFCMDKEIRGKAAGIFSTPVSYE